ncbi:hypothetical protein [Amycolatopsis thermoflava]|uniref:hypothetical protein n=1 Tax=Amycolatopsis thermoflava TaxID=84480 RepID=UPI000484F355|nr:hypothetical protein [Amycolatopsis thermoflava]
MVQVAGTTALALAELVADLGVGDLPQVQSSGRPGTQDGQDGQDDVEVAADPFVANGFVAAASLAAQNLDPGTEVTGHHLRQRVEHGRDGVLEVPVAAFGVQVGHAAATGPPAFRAWRGGIIEFQKATLVEEIEQAVGRGRGEAGGQGAHVTLAKRGSGADPGQQGAQHRSASGHHAGTGLRCGGGEFGEHGVGIVGEGRKFGSGQSPNGAPVSIEREQSLLVGVDQMR